MEYLIIICIISYRTLVTGIMTECPTHCECKNSVMKCSNDLPDFIPKSITKVEVEEADFGRSFDFDRSSWGNVTSLSINAGLSVSNASTNSQRTLKEGEFIQLKNLEYLKLKCRCLGMIDKNAFNGLNDLKVLDLSDNTQLRMDIVVDSLIGPGILPNLSELYLSNINFIRFTLSKDFFDAVKNKTLKVLDISNNKRVWFEQDGIKTAFPYLETLNVSGDGIVVMSFRLFYPNDTSFRRLKVLDISYPSSPIPVDTSTTDASDGNFDPSSSSFLPIGYFPPNLTELYCRKVVAVPIRLTGVSNSTHLCLYMHNNARQFCYIGTSESLRKVVLAENSFLFIDSKLLHFLEYVQVLDISRNLLGDAISAGNYARTCLDILKRVEVLNLSANKISKFPHDAFRSSKALKILDLSNNKLGSITFDTDTLLSLESLDISHNEITFLDSASIERLNVLQANVMVPINLRGNPLICSCKSRKFIEWVIQNYPKDKYPCILDSEVTYINQHALERAEYLCIETTVIILSSSAVTIIVTIILVVILVFFITRVKRRRKLQQQRQIEMGVEMYEKRQKVRPVFLSFCNEDVKVIMDEIFPRLDAGLREILKTDSRCVATGYSDFRPGFSVANEIIRCIETSSVVVFFVTNAFCQKMWCRNETLVAKNDNKPVVLIMWEEVDVKVMPKHLYKHFQQYVRVHRIVKDGKRVMMPDWKELCETIVRLFPKNTAPL